MFFRGSPKKRLQNQLAEIAAVAELLANNLTRHTDMCSYPTLKASLAELAEAETAQSNAMRQLLLQHGVSPKLASGPPHDGSSNWERLRNDLDLQIAILRGLNSQYSAWIGIDPELAEQLREYAANQERRIGQLRDLTLRCDPQALD